MLKNCNTIQSFMTDESAANVKSPTFFMVAVMQKVTKQNEKTFL